MALKKIELPDELLAKLGATKSPKELGEIVESYVVAGMECVRFSKDNIMLNKEQEINTMVKEALKEINQKILSDL